MVFGMYSRDTKGVGDCGGRDCQSHLDRKYCGEYGAGEVWASTQHSRTQWPQGRLARLRNEVEFPDEHLTIPAILPLFFEEVLLRIFPLGDEERSSP